MAKVKTTSRRNPGSKRPAGPDVKPESVRHIEAAAAASGLWGEIITWSAGGEQAFANVTKALHTAGLSDEVAKEMLPKHAWTRASQKLAKERVILLVDDSQDGKLTFQINRVLVKDKAATFPAEARLTLDLKSGKVECDESAGLAAAAQEALDRAIAVRTAGDITQIVQRLFDREGGAFPDLYPIRQQGGAYFVPARYDHFTNKIEQFLDAMGGGINRFPVPKGATASGDRSVAGIVLDGVKAVVAGYKLEASGFDMEKTRESTFDRKIETVRQAREKLLELRAFLGANVETLDAELEEIDGTIKKAAGEAKRFREADFTVACPGCATECAMDKGETACTCRSCGLAFEVEWDEAEEAPPAKPEKAPKKAAKAGKDDGADDAGGDGADDALLARAAS